jgi:hypothetical protein
MPIDPGKLEVLRTAFIVAIIVAIMSGVAYIIFYQAQSLPGASAIQTPLNNLALNATNAMGTFYQMLGLLIIVGVIGIVMDIFASRFGGGGG